MPTTEATVEAIMLLQRARLLRLIAATGRNRQLARRLAPSADMAQVAVREHRAIADNRVWAVDSAALSVVPRLAAVAAVENARLSVRKQAGCLTGSNSTRAIRK